MDRGLIYQQSERCCQLLEHLIQALALGDELQAWSEEMQLRTRLFTSKLGVFAGGSLSVEHRLRRNKAVARGINQILEALLLNLQSLLSVLDVPSTAEDDQLARRHADQSPTGQTPSESDSNASDDDIEPCSEDEIDVTIDNADSASDSQIDRITLGYKLRDCVSDNVEDLLRYTALIKQLSQPRSEERANTYSPPETEEDEDDECDMPKASLSSRFATYAEGVLQREFGPQRYADPSLADVIARLKSSMLRRWRRTCYRRAHAERLATQDRLTGATMQTGFDTRTSQPHAVPSIDEGAARPTSEVQALEPKARTAQSAATTLPSDFSVSRPPQARSQTTKSMSRAGGIELSLPQIPKSQRLGADYVYDCPYCGSLPVTPSPLANRSWRKHLWSDLEPYTCLYTGCASPGTDYRSLHTWLEHITAAHSTSMWVCAKCPTSYPTYTAQDLFVAHLHQDHGFDSRGSDVLSIARYSRMDGSWSECLICGSEEGIRQGSDTQPRPVTSSARQEDLQACMANHLEALALSSLPWHFGSIHNASSSQAEGTASNQSVASMSISHSPEQEAVEQLGSTTLAAIASNAENEGEKGILDMINDWTSGMDIEITDEDEEEPAVPPPQGVTQSDSAHSVGQQEDGREARALFDFLAETDDRLRFRQGDIIKVIDDTDDTWWRGQHGSATGRFPSYAVDDSKAPRPLRKYADATPLLEGAKAGDTAVVKLLLAMGEIDPNTKNKVYGRTPLVLAVQNGRQAVVEALLSDSRVNIYEAEYSGNTPLGCAARAGHAAIVRLLLSKGDANIDTSTNAGSQTPLSLAAQGGHREVVLELLDTGKVDVNARSRTELQTPLWLAAMNGHEKVVQLLLEQESVEIDAQDRAFGGSPLSIAAERGHEAVVRMLVGKGADISSTDSKYGRTPLEWATSNGHQGVADILKAHSGYMDSNRALSEPHGF